MNQEEVRRGVKISASRKFTKAHQKAGYRLFGKNLAAYKPCHYWKSALTKRIFCYKYWFYGVPPSHRCIQWSPTIECNEACQFCWRMHRNAVGLSPFKKEEMEEINWPEPADLLEELLKTYEGIHKGFAPRSRKKTEKDLWHDAIKKPLHLAISLTGEPLIYPYMDELVRLAEKNDMTTFIVSNGTLPKRIEQMRTLPTQLYLTLAGPTYQTWVKAVKPLWNARKQWKKLKESLSLLSSLNTRTVIRITAVKGLNMKNPRKYADLIKKAEPNFISIKGFSHVGGARNRLSAKNQPQMEDIEVFARKLAEEISYKIEEKVERGRVILLWNGEGERMIQERAYEKVRR